MSQPGTPSMIGRRFRAYELVALIGAGGMGDVYRAHDTRLGRDVAIKILPRAFKEDPDRVARFEREARVLASLNHPHIGAIYGVEDADDVTALVMELVEGEDLSARIARGRLPIHDALTIARQVADAIDAAHEHGIIHRDLKPANIRVQRDGTVKVLDFGLAKPVSAAGTETPALTAMSHAGAIMGTPAYMSPEQARGEVAGREADIWALGVVLHEMLTGRSPFGRPTLAETLASVLDAQPDYSALPPDTPPLARRLIERCLARDPKRRLRHMGDVRIDVEDALATLRSGSTPIDGRAAAKTPTGPAAWIAGGVAVAVLAGAGIWFLARRSAAERSSTPVHVSIPFLGSPRSQPFGTRQLAISPDGSSVAFVSTNQLWVRRMDQKDAVAIARGTASNPFFSPDGEWVGFSSADTGLVKVPVRGGAPVMIAPITDRPAGAAWRSDGTIVFATSDGLYAVSADGGVPKLLVKPDRGRKELLYAWPHFLPGGQSLLFTIVTEDAGGGPHVARLDLKTLEHRTVLQGSSAHYLPSGHMAYVTGSTLHAVAFDAGTGATLGKPVSFPEIELATAVDNGAANFAISETGTLLFTAPRPPTLRGLEWVDRHGQREALAVEPQTYAYPRVSPDGTRVAVERTTRGNRDIWILDLKRLTQTQLTDGPTEDMMPVWSVDGRRVFFASMRTGNFDVYSQAADGATSARVEFASPEAQIPAAFTPDGTRLLVYDRFQDIGILNLAHPDRLEPLLHSEFDERLAQVSPDGRWVAYESDESGSQFEIILRSFPNVNERREKISENGGRYPLWGPKGSNELYYVTLDGTMMAASIRLSPTLALGAVTKLFVWQKPPEGRSGVPFDVAPDGRFLMTKLTAPNPDGPTNVSVILNWMAHVQKQVPR